jgi:hypothetical protein
MSDLQHLLWACEVVDCIQHHNQVEGGLAWQLAVRPIVYRTQGTQQSVSNIVFYVAWSCSWHVIVTLLVVGTLPCLTMRHKDAIVLDHHASWICQTCGTIRVSTVLRNGHALTHRHNRYTQLTSLIMMSIWTSMRLCAEHVDWLTAGLENP